MMENEQNQCSMTPFICSIVPIVFAAVLIGLVAVVSPGSFRPAKGCFGDFGAAIVLLCVGSLIVLVTGPLGVISVLSGFAALKEPAARGKTLVVVAIVLGILETVTVAGCFFWVIVAASVR